MTLPPIIKLIIDCPEGGDLSGLIFQMQVSSGTKNPFYIRFLKTATDGASQITADDFRGQFNDHYEMGLMDFNGSIETAGEMVRLALFDPQNMSEQQAVLSRWPLFKHEQKVWQSRREFIDYHLSCCNRDFCFLEKSVCIPEDGIIRLTVTRKIGVINNAI
jgi:hypothetical protein